MTRHFDRQGRKRTARGRWSVLAVVFALLVQAGLAAPAGARGMAASPTVQVICSVHGAMDARDLGLTPADFGYAETQSPPDGTTGTDFSCPLCQAHTLDRTAPPTQPVMPPPLAVTRLGFPAADEDRPRALDGVVHAARGPPSA